jgi:hypothetical protein
MVGEWKRFKKSKWNKKFRENNKEKIENQPYYGTPFSDKWKKHLEDLFEQKLVGSRKETGGRKVKLSRLQKLYVESLIFGGNDKQQGQYLKSVNYDYMIEQRRIKWCVSHKLYYQKNKDKIKEKQKAYMFIKEHRIRRSMVVYLNRNKSKFIKVLDKYPETRYMSDEEVKVAYLKMKTYNKQHRGEVIE